VAEPLGKRDNRLRRLERERGKGTRGQSQSDWNGGTADLRNLWYGFVTFGWGR
jgi:hypothetical protein